MLRFYNSLCKVSNTSLFPKLITCAMSKKAICTSKAPSAIGSYSQAIMVKDTLYISGQLGLVPSTMQFAGDDVQSQTKQALQNMGAILNEAGMNFSNVVKATVLLEDINDFAAANEIYKAFFTEPFPARAAYQVAKLPKLGKIEIEAIAVKMD